MIDGKRFYGYIPSPQDDRDYDISRLVKSAPILPASYVTKVPLHIFDQGDSSMCVGCSIANLKRIIEYKQTGDTDDFSPAYIYGNRRVDDYRGEGLVPRQALKTLQDFGICHLKFFPGNYSYTSAAKYYSLQKIRLDAVAYPYRISSYYRLNNIHDIKTAIFTLGGALLAYDVYNCLMEPGEDGVIKYDPNNLGENLGGHQMLAVGWNQTGFIVVNSWSNDYGIGFEELNTEGGVIIIPYSYMPTEAWAVVDEVLEQSVMERYPGKVTFSDKIKNFFKKLFGKNI